MTAPVRWTRDKRLGGLWRFAIAITTLNVFGHTLLGFEQPWIVPLVVLATAYGLEIAIEAADAWASARRPRFLGGPRTLAEFLLSAHISALAVGMLVYGNERLWVMSFASAAAIASKALFRVGVGPILENGTRASRHFLNPSNFGVSLTLLLVPWAGGAPPYQYVENVSGAWDLGLPLLVFASGSLLNTTFTGRIPLAAAWVGGFVAQGLARSALNGTPWEAALAPMTGLAFVLYTFYMVTDPGTTPEQRWSQVAFGAGVALTYGLIVQSHHVFGFYYALTIVSGIRGLWLASRTWLPASWWRAVWQPRAWEYRWRALPMFLTQGLAVLANAWWTGSLAMPVTPARGAVAVVLGALAVWLRVWGVGLISSATMVSMSLATDRLVTSGVYGLVRNPLYLADLLLFLGYACFLPLPIGIAFMAFHLGRTLRLIAFEESQLAARHGSAFAEYVARVPRLWPRAAKPPAAAVDWREGLAASAIWVGFAAGYVAVWLAGDVWAITPFETAGFAFAALYFSRARRLLRRPVGAA
jgi:protein-S-isoprenylcysteine O-methyltransferase Ste14